MSVRVRFAPSPTGQVHIGNIRAAIFNWLFARHEKGTFLLRIEDTDLERSTPEAIKTLLEVMEWLGLDFDEKPPLYQTSQVSKHLAAVQKLLDQGDAYKDAKGGGGEAVLFKIPWHAENVPGVHEVGPAEIAVHPETPVVISYKGVDYAALSSKGKAAPGGGALAGFKDLQVLDAEDKVLFDIHGQEEAVLKGELVKTIEGAAKLRFTRRAITYHDLVKGDMTKPLDGMKDVVIVRSDGSPVFHIANVVDDITQGVTHIIRGDDHVENTFRHIMMFSCLGAPVPQYGHLPMIVNVAGKPYSKRDGDAFVGDFKDKGFLADTMVNYLALLGWNPGDEREKMSREELIEAFSLDRCQHTPAQMDIQKMTNLNGQYLAEMEIGKFTEMCKSYLAVYDWGREDHPKYLRRVCTLMQSRLKKFADVEQWKYFFVETPDYDEKNLAKQFKDFSTFLALGTVLKSIVKSKNIDAKKIEEEINRTTEKLGMGQGKLNQPLRAAVTGVGIGAGIYETLELLGKERTIKRLKKIVFVGFLVRTFYLIEQKINIWKQNIINHDRLIYYILFGKKKMTDNYSFEEKIKMYTLNDLNESLWRITRYTKNKEFIEFLEIWIEGLSDNLQYVDELFVKEIVKLFTELDELNHFIGLKSSAINEELNPNEQRAIVHWKTMPIYDIKKQTLLENSFSEK